MQRLALDHMTIVDADPFTLARTAQAVGYDGMCLFMEPMDVLPLMPPFDLYGDARQRRALRAMLGELGISLDLVYPFTLAGRSDPAAFETALACAAELGARFVNVLAFDRDPARLADRFAAFCDRADSFGLGVAVEFYPPSQIRSLAEALALVAAVDRPGRVGVNVDLLHLMRSGGSIAELAAAPPGRIVFAQISDGPAFRPPETWEHEASSDRLLPGEGDFPVAAFLAALPQGCAVSIEVPRSGRAMSLGVAERAAAALAATRRLLGAL